MAAPTDKALDALKRMGRFLSSRRRLVYEYPWQSAERVDVYSDTDWAGCPKTRKSTSGGCVMLGRHLIKSWSSTQASVSLSSGESEFYGVVKAAGIGLGYRSLLHDLGVTLPLRVWTDSTATIGICSRQGLGKLRHVDAQCLWIQQRVRDGTFELLKVRGEVNPADLFTKHLAGGDRVSMLLALFGCQYRDGRAATAPQLRQATGTSKGESLLQVAQNLERVISWGGRTFPAVEDQGELLPEAYLHDISRLPHLHEDYEFVFPAAQAAMEKLEMEIPEDGQLEDRGIQLGISGN